MSVAIVLFKRPVRPSVSATFRGFTNDANGTRLASFVISNASSWSVERFGTYRVQQAQGKGWTNYNEGWFVTAGSNLPAGGSEIITLPAATNQPRWRVAFNVGNKEGFLLKAASQWIFEAQNLGLPTQHRSLSYSVWTNPIEE